MKAPTEGNDDELEAPWPKEGKVEAFTGGPSPKAGDELVDSLGAPNENVEAEESCVVVDGLSLNTSDEAPWTGVESVLAT